jgi:hypothetical protein
MRILHSPFFLVPVIAFVASLPGLFSYLPRLSVSQAGNLSPDQPFGTIFQVTNGGYFTVHDVIGNCRIVKFGPNISNLGVTNAPPEMGDISPGRTVGINCQNGFITNQNVDGLQMAIDLSYQPALWFWRKHENYDFVVVSSGHGFVWKPVN